MNLDGSGPCGYQIQPDVGFQDGKATVGVDAVARWRKDVDMGHELLATCCGGIDALDKGATQPTNVSVETDVATFCRRSCAFPCGQ